MEKIKICHLTSVHNRTDGRIFLKMCNTLQKAHFDVTLVVADGKGDDFVDGVKIKDVGSEKNRFKRFYKSLKKIYKESIKLDYEIYHIHDPELIPVGLKLKKRGKKVIFDSHEDFPGQMLEKEWIPKILRKLLSSVSRLYLNRTLKKLDLIITVSPHIVDILKKISENVYLVTNFPIIDDEYEKFSSSDYISRSNKVCYSGTVYNNSSQENILKALNKVINVNYIIVGNITNKYLNKLLILPSWNKTTFIERVPKNELLQIYREVTIGIVLFEYSPNVGYKKGTLGNNKIFEYMQAGLPIICTDFELWKNIIDKYKCGLYVNPYNVNEIRDAIEFLSTNKDVAYNMGQNGIKAVKEEFNWSSQGKNLLKIYDNLLQ